MFASTSAVLVEHCPRPIEEPHVKEDTPALPFRHFVPLPNVDAAPAPWCPAENIVFIRNGRTVLGPEMSLDELVCDMPIKGGFDPVLLTARGGTMRLLLHWPGYLHEKFQEIQVIRPDGRPIKKSQLGQMVARHYIEFLNGIPPEECVDKNWLMEPARKNPRNVILGSVDNPAGDILVAQLYVTA
ncbi:hypothetical protein BKA93DRAFT_827509 [Sparassis latifolia]|uniref:Uncharacterized protein n=1 Tax=Sparassis crispa TaxID=139825 RepID=A0A401H0K1_9APHY|nr:hypothetical protein SCP_1201810 [Sparassis crispa]GBE87955.1 hypothetical protein SCP_1201810 [Sparassis crispa]